MASGKSKKPPGKIAIANQTRSLSQIMLSSG